jgi:hypothetical protein
LSGEIPSPETWTAKQVISANAAGGVDVLLGEEEGEGLATIALLWLATRAESEAGNCTVRVRAPGEESEQLAIPGSSAKASTRSEDDRD